MASSNSGINRCPKCDIKLRKGYIQAAHRIAWVPEVNNIVVEPTWKKDAVRLSKQGYRSINYVEAYLCESCEYVHIDYSE